MLIRVLQMKDATEIILINNSLIDNNAKQIKKQYCPSSEINV